MKKLYFISFSFLVLASAFSSLDVYAQSDMTSYCKYKDGIYNEVIDTYYFSDTYSENFLKKWTDIYIATSAINRDENSPKTSDNTKIVLQKHDCENKVKDQLFAYISEIWYWLGTDTNLGPASIDAFDGRFIIYHTTIVWKYSMYRDVYVYDTLKKTNFSFAYDMPDISIWGFLWFKPDRVWFGIVQVRNPEWNTAFYRYNLFKKMSNPNLAVSRLKGK